MEIGAKKAELAELRNQVHGESGFAAVLLNDGNDFVFDKFARGLADEFFLVVQLRIEIDKIHSAKFGHAWRPCCASLECSNAPDWPATLLRRRDSWLDAEFSSAETFCLPECHSKE